MQSYRLQASSGRQRLRQSRPLVQAKNKQTLNACTPQMDPMIDQVAW